MGHLIIAQVLALVGVAFAVFQSVMGKLVADECKAWTPRLTEWLIALAAKRLPQDQRGSYEKEWRSDVSDIPGDLSKIFWAARCVLAARRILPETETESTKVGRFLRRTSIDEMPQLLNVLKGEMSLVGPRPLTHPPAEIFDGDHLRPGITGYSWVPNLNCTGDFALGSLMLLAILPLLFGAAIAIIVESRGPVLFSAKRIGRNGKSFMILKFRTMRWE